MNQMLPHEYLKKVDPVLSTLIEKVAPFKKRNGKDFYKELVESIISQQLSIKAADTIYNRFIKLFPDTFFPTPLQVIQIDKEKMRTVGISYAKISYIKDLAQKIESKKLDLSEIHKLDDEAVINYLIQVKGIGRWTAEMFLMFSLGRDDIFSFGDLGLRNAIQKLYKLKRPLTKNQAIKISKKWKPYRTWACRYLWASLNLKEQT